MSNAHSSLIGRTLGNRYVVERVLGTGAMGTVYCARQIDLGAQVAVKVLHPRLATDPGLVQRFEQEAFATSRLDHPNALRVLDFGQDGDLLYIVTEYVDAEDLLTIMETAWPLADERIVSILSQVLDALIAVHEIGIVHRDLKPENILVLDDQNDDGAKVEVVKICDFGIAKIARQTLAKSHSFARRLTVEGMVVGTPDYMSPEQARGQSVDGRSDLYSVGVVLYHLLAGQTPFTADSPVGIALQHVSEAPVPPSHHRNVHPGLEAVCLRALCKRPEDRFQTAREMRKALRDTLTSDSTALALVSRPVASLHLGSSFSTSSPAMVPLPQAIARHRFRANQRWRRRWALAYAAVASVTITASAFVASRGGGPTERVEAADQVHAAIALVSSPSLETPQTPPPERPPEPGPVTIEPATTVAGPPSELTSTIAVSPSEPPRRPVSRPRQQPSTKPHGHSSFVAVAPTALPIPAVSPAPTSSVLLVRSDPWPNPADAPESPAPAAVSPESRVPPTSPEPREPSESRMTPPSRAQGAPSGSLDIAHASVGISGVSTSPGISAAKVKIGLSHVPILACYQQALRARPSEAPIVTDLRLTIDIGGRIIGATLSRDGDLLGLRGCIESSARSARIRDVDTGDGTATVQLRFSPR